MIKNERQYQSTKAQAREFEKAIAGLSDQPVPRGVDPRMARVHAKALESQLEELNADIREYEALKAGKITTFDAHSLDELPTLLVKARIARSLTHKELAGRLRIKEQQLQRWESNDYRGASLENLRAVADALDVEFTVQVTTA